jgi:hypothetical protein
MQEISTLMPANAAQARNAAQIVIVRGLADTLATRAYEPELTVPQMCRLGRAAADLVRTAAGLERALVRSQQMPAPFFGTVLADEVDVAEVAAGWGKRTTEAEGPVAGDLTAGMAAAGTAAAGMAPAGMAAAGTTAAGTAPAGTAPVGTAPVGTAPVGMAGTGPAMTVRVGAVPARTLGASGENAELDAMNRESAPEATVAQGLGAAA